MKRRILSLFIAASLIVCALPAAAFADTATVSIDDKAVVYTPNSDYKSGDCILTASRNMIRRAAILRGSKEWSNITNASLRKDATIFGLLWHNFSHSADGLKYTIKCEKFKGKTEKERINEFEALIKDHPEGVVVWGKKSSSFGEHGVLLTSVINGVPYAADSAHNLGEKNKGIEKWNKTTMYSPLKCTQYWYIKSVDIAKGAPLPAPGQPLAPISAGAVNTESTLKISDASIPSAINKGKAFYIEGVVESNYRISAVNISIMDSTGSVVISETETPNAWNYSLKKLDSRIKFGKLEAGSYRYVVRANDEKTSRTLVDCFFRVVEKKKAKSTLKIKSHNAPQTLSLGQKYVIKGKISSNKIVTKVTAQVVDESGNTVIKASARNLKKSFNIKKKLDPKMKFGTLQRGSYYYKIIAKDTKQTKTLVNKAFIVN
ncbi:MAG: hypothetical protein IKE52_06840 [Mogibacterium sp.]|nr:hypothetical protein [Mogibacterium sp.]